MERCAVAIAGGCRRAPERAGFRLPTALSRGLALAASLFALGCSSRYVEEPAGREVYLRHCASCHGDAGKGDGPVAASLRRPPSDLTTIAQRGGGRFDEVRVMQVIDGRSLVAEHGTRAMPVWGIVFEEEVEGEPYAGYTSLLRSRNLTDYLHSIQP
jgi:mono/diheme cytochrome c family protein